MNTKKSHFYWIERALFNKTWAQFFFAPPLNRFTAWMLVIIFFFYFHILFRLSSLFFITRAIHHESRTKRIMVRGSVGTLTYNWNALNLKYIPNTKKIENAQIQFRKNDANEAVHHVCFIFLLHHLFRFGKKYLAFFVAHECVQVSDICIAY